MTKPERVDFRKLQPETLSKVVQCIDCKNEFAMSLARQESFICWQCQETRREKEKTEAMIRDSKIPKRFLEFEVRRTELLNKLVEAKKSVYLHGKNGSGKTVFACQLLRALCFDTRETPHFLRSTRFILGAQSSYRKEGGPTEYVDNIASFRFLCFDDLGKEKWTDETMNFFFEMLAIREERDLLTIFTSNYNLKEISELMDNAVASRIAGMCRVIEFKGADLRLLDEDKPF